MKFLQIIIGTIFLCAAIPFICIGYIAAIFWAVIYFGWDKSMKHQYIIVKLQDNKKTTNRS